MNKLDLINLLVKNGIQKKFAMQIINPYQEIAAFSYSIVKNSNSNMKYVNSFGNAYNDYGLYIFYTVNTCDIQYIGEAASEPFQKRLSQHFNKSHGELLYKKQISLNILQKCEVLILYGKYNNSEARKTHFDEDLLIGIFKPQLNDR